MKINYYTQPLKGVKTGNQLTLSGAIMYNQ